MNTPRYLFPLRARSDLPMVGFVLGTGVSFVLWMALGVILWWFVYP